MVYPTAADSSESQSAAAVIPVSTEPEPDQKTDAVVEEREMEVTPKPRSESNTSDSMEGKAQKVCVGVCIYCFRPLICPGDLEDIFLRVLGSVKSFVPLVR